MRGLVILLALLCLACVEGTPQPQPTPLPAKVVAGKVQQERLIDPTLYWLVAADETMCFVSMPAYALAKVGETVECDWRKW